MSKKQMNGMNATVANQLTQTPGCNGSGDVHTPQLDPLPRETSTAAAGSRPPSRAWSIDAEQD